jgi:hypothetical protein
MRHTVSRSVPGFLWLSLVMAGLACSPPAKDDGAGGAGGASATGGSTGTGGTAGSGTAGSGGAGTGGSGTGGSGAAPAQFARDIRPLFIASCNDCHHTGSAIGYDFTKPFDAATGIVGRANSWVPNGSTQTKVVDPGNVANSFIITKVTRTDLDPHIDGNPMPQHLAPLTQAELDAVRQWITDGAKNDAFFAASVAPIFGTEVTLGGKAGKCTWCHYRGAPTGVSVLDVFDATTGLVNKPSRYMGKVVEPGNADASMLMKKLLGTGPGPKMPYQPPRLDAAQVQKLKDWIAAGAKND